MPLSTEDSRVHRRRIDRRSGVETVILLIICQCRARQRPKHSIDLAMIISLIREFLLHVSHYLVGSQIVVAVNRPVIRIKARRGVVTPRRIPEPGIPIVPAAADQDDPRIMRPPPHVIVPQRVIIPKDDISLAVPVLRPNDPAVRLKRYA